MEQLVEENNTANILLTLSENCPSTLQKPLTNSDGNTNSTELIVPKGNIIDHIRQTVRLEAASSSSGICVMLKGKIGHSVANASSSAEMTPPSLKKLKTKSKDDYGDEISTAGESHNDHTDVSAMDDDVQNSRDEDGSDYSQHGCETDDNNKDAGYLKYVHILIIIFPLKRFICSVIWPFSFPFLLGEKETGYTRNLLETGKSFLPAKCKKPLKRWNLIFSR